VAVDVDQHPVLTWLQARQKPITIVLTVVFVIGLVAWYVVESGRRKQVQAADALDRARAAMESGNYPQAATEFQRVAQNYSGTDAAFEATLAQNQVRMLSGQSQLAVDELKKFVAANPPAYFKSAGLSHLGMALENTGKAAEAVTSYRQAADLATEDYRKIDALLNAARVEAQLGKQKEAVEILEGVVKKYKESTPGVVEAKVRLAQLTGGRV
jgi:tetratricopeptide (TPR) repeat protein